MFKLKTSQLYKLNRPLCLFIRKYTTINKKNPKPKPPNKKLLQNSKFTQNQSHQNLNSRVFKIQWQETLEHLGVVLEFKLFEPLIWQANQWDKNFLLFTISCILWSTSSLLCPDQEPAQICSPSCCSVFPDFFPGKWRTWMGNVIGRLQSWLYMG